MMTSGGEANRSVVKCAARCGDQNHIGLKKTRCVMTTDKAIELLKSWDGVYIGYSSDDVEEAHNKAISALAFMDVLEKAYKCPSMLLDKGEKLDEIMLAYQKIR